MAWQPDPNLPFYHGPYPVLELVAARRELINQLANSNNVLLERTKPKIGIASQFGQPVPLKPVVTHRRFSDVAETSSTQSSSRGGASAFSSHESTNSSASSTNSSPVPVVTPLMDVSIGEKRSLANANSSLNDFEDSAIDTQDPLLRYKCDYCSFMCEQSQQAQDHLARTQHQTASLYRVLGENSTQLQAVVERLSVKNTTSTRKSLVVVCPTCKAVFPDIFTCGMHTRLSHAAPQDCYAVCSLVREQMLKLCRDPIKCEACAQTFSSHSRLHSHWRDVPSHDPLAAGCPPCTFSIGICVLCPKERTYLNVVDLKSHLLTKHSQGARSTFTVKQQIILEPKQVDYLPHNDESVADGERKDIKLLNEMKTKVQRLGLPREETNRIKQDVKRNKSFRRIHSQ